MDVQYATMNRCKEPKVILTTLAYWQLLISSAHIEDNLTSYETNVDG